jgi:hypothetical protein
MTVEVEESTASTIVLPDEKDLDAQKNRKSIGQDKEKICCDPLLKSVETVGEGKTAQNQLQNFSTSCLDVKQIPSLSNLEDPYPPVIFMEDKGNDIKEDPSGDSFPTRLLVLKSENKFPWLTETESFEYKKYSRMCFDVMSIGPLICLITVFYCCHANFQYAMVDGPFFISGLVFGLIASYQYYVFFLFGHTVRRYQNLSDLSKSRISSFESFIFNSKYFEDSIAIMATISASSYLYARVLNGQCAPDTTLWVSR